VTSLANWRRRSAVKSIHRPVKFQLLLHKVKFYKRLFLKSGLLHDVFWIYLLTDADDRIVFSSLNTAVNDILLQFYDYVNT